MGNIVKELQKMIFDEVNEKGFLEMTEAWERTVPYIGLRMFLLENDFVLERKIIIRKGGGVDCSGIATAGHTSNMG